MHSEAGGTTNTVIQQLLAGPSRREQLFTSAGVTFGDVYDMAAALRSRFTDEAVRGPVCLATERKEIIAACLLSSLAGGPPLLLPYAQSAGVLARMQECTGYTAAVTDGPAPLPSGVRSFGAERGSTESWQCVTEPAPDAELMRIYTGGSTGRPQLWRKSCENIVAEAHNLANTQDIRESDVILATVSCLHIYGLLFAVALPLVAAATVVDGTPSFPTEIEEEARRNGAAVLVSVPAHYRILANRAMQLRLAFSSAGMLAEEDSHLFSRTCGVGVTEVYGSTETGGIATRNRHAGEKFFTPFATVSWKIVGERLAVRSPYISADLPLDHEGYFLTGDRVAKADETCFDLRGRVDTIAKIGGKRVDCEEIRSCIVRLPGVADCAVLVREEKSGRQHRLDVLVQGTAIDCTAIRRQLEQHFEPYALPRRIVATGRIPLKTNGKYDWEGIASMVDR